MEPSDDRLTLKAIVYLFEMVDNKFDIEIKEVKEVIVNSERYTKYINIQLRFKIVIIILNRFYFYLKAYRF